MNDSTSHLDADAATSTTADRFSSSDNFDAKDTDGMENSSRAISRKKSKRYSVVDRRRQNNSRAEQHALLAEKDDSDLEHNIGRLCQYLSGSEDGDDEDNRQENGATGLQRPAGLFVLNSHYRKRNVLASDTSSLTAVSDENCNCATTQQMPILQSDTLAQVIPMQRLVPRDFLNIPPPAQPPPPDDSPSIDRPLPPQRSLPPLPDEPLYEEAKPAPPSPMPRPSKQPLQPNKYSPVSSRTATSSGKASAVVSPVMVSSYHATAQRDDELPSKLCLSQGNQFNDIDWHNYETSILERNESGFYIPSSQTTMSSISPSRKSEMDPQRHNNYLLSPAAQSSMPVPVLPTRQELPSTNRSRLHQFYPKGKLSLNGKDGSPGRFSWKCMTYLLAAALVFAFAVLFFLLYTVFSSGSLNSTQSSLTPSPSSNLGFSTYATGLIDEDGTKRLSTAVLRPLPESFALGDDFFADLVPGNLAHTYFTLQRNSYVRFNVSLDPQTKLAIYGRQTLPASPTQYDFVQIIRGAKFHTRRFDSGRTARSIRNLKRFSENLRSSSFVQYLAGGRWHLSIWNDDTEIRTVRIAASVTDSEKEECKNNCHNKGVCKEGKCYCFDGYTGAHCEETFCPVLCSGNGIFSNGKCHCHHGWKGADCDVPSNECEIPSCNGHGHCNNKGECVCDKGYRGPFCDQRSCSDENCGGHGVCHNGKCYCDFGYVGERCDTPQKSEGLCPVSSSVAGQCSGRGHLDASSEACNCQDGWTGSQCEKKICHLNCGVHGKCVDEACSCDEGFSGDKCDQLTCAPGCEDNGKCVNGSCLCNDGWYGDNCQLAGCPNLCNHNGECKKVKGNWRCVCSTDFAGDDCSIPLESQCSDNIDNDSDGLVDCEDSECCGSKTSCQNDQYCRTVPDPYQVLVRKPPAHPQASFYQKTSFLLDGDSVQQYPNAIFNESRMSVVRGRVVTARGGALIAVRIADASNALFGFTLSRAEGYFDLVVDGGGAVTLQFMRKPFATQYLTVVVPWNQIVYVGNIVMTMKDELANAKESSQDWSQTCLDTFKQHVIKPFAVPSWKHGHHGIVPSALGIVADSAAVQESLRIPGMDIFLTYSSSNAVGKESTLSLYLIPESVPKNLRLVRLTIDVEGVHFETTLAAKSNLTYVYGWDKTNVYKQRVTGLAATKVSVGYVYANCDRPFWETLNVKLKGHVAAISDIGSWNLNVHHRYNVLDNILEKGNGGAVYLREELSMLAVTLGTKEQRPLTCPTSICNGQALSALLYMPIAVASSRDGSLFVGDFNLVRMVGNNSKNITTVLELSIADTAHRYFLAVHPISGDLYVSLPLRRQVWKVRNLLPSVDDLATNYDVVVGTGEICSVGSDCGDGASAELALLTYPKGIVFDTFGNLYIADDRRIRLVSTSGFMSTVIGSSSLSDYATNWQPLSCSTIFSTSSFRPQWPTSLTFDPYSSNLIFLDTDVIFEVTAGGNFINVRAGAPAHCAQLKNPDNSTVKPTLLKGATAIASADDGRILLAETDRRKVHRIRSFDRYGRVTLLAGAESKCDCRGPNCLCDGEGGKMITAKNARLHNPTSLAVDQRGNVHVADEGIFQIRTLKSVVPTLDQRTKLYKIPASDSQEVYYFNRHGQHVGTKDTLTNAFIYNFTYHLDTSYGKLNHISGTGGHSIYVIRKSEDEILIENTSGMSKVDVVDGMLEKFILPSGGETHFGYDAHTGLLNNKVDSSKRAWFYEYDSHGRLKAAVLPTGDVLTLKYGLVRDQLLLEVKNQTGLDWQTDGKSKGFSKSPVV